MHHSRCSSVIERVLRVGMDVARLKTAFGKWLRTVSRRRFDHAVDNSGDSVGLVADWVAITRRRRSHSPAAGRCGNHPGHQPCDRTARGLKFATDYTDDHGSSRSLSYF